MFAPHGVHIAVYLDKQTEDHVMAGDRESIWCATASGGLALLLYDITKRIPGVQQFSALAFVDKS